MKNIFLLGIRSKLLMAAVFLVIITVVPISALVYFNFSNALILKDQEKLDQTARISAFQLDSMFWGFERDILLLSHMPSVVSLTRVFHNQVVNARDSLSIDMQRSRVEAIFSDVLQSNSSYGAVRLIGIDGSNLDIAKNIKYNSYQLTALERLRIVGDKSCFISAKKLEKGEVFIAEPVLSNWPEKGKATNLVGCISAPVFNNNEELSAVLVVDLYLGEMFNTLYPTNNDKRSFYLSNDSGTVLLYPQRDKEILEQYGAQEFLQRKLPVLYQYLASEGKNKKSLVIDDVMGRELLVSIQEILINRKKHQFILHLIVAHPYEDILVTAFIADASIIIGIGLVFVLSIIFTLLVARSLTKPIGLILHALNAYEPGKPAPYLPLRRKDEIGVLARAYREVMQSGEKYRIEIARRTAEQAAMQLGLQRLSSAMEQCVEGIMIVDREGVIEYVNHQVEEMFGYSSNQSVGKHYGYVGWTGIDNKYYKKLSESMKKGESWSGEIVINSKDERNLYLHFSTSPIVEGNGQITGFVMIGRDISRRVQMELEHRAMEQQLNQAQKLESVGRLAAGIAHEINTPIQYVSDNVVFLQSAFEKVLHVLDSGEEILQSAVGGEVPRQLIEIMRTTYKEAKVDFLLKQAPLAFDESLEGLSRVTTIVGAMKEFSHPAQDKTLVDINRAIQSTITVATNEWKYVADFKTDFCSSLPLVPCLPGEFNQVILNIIINAAHAIGEIVGDDGAHGKGMITIRTAINRRWIEIHIGDTGAGISKEDKPYIFDAFFTTKTVGRGTGQGLSIAYNVIVEKHGGTIGVDSVLGQGSTFCIRLPLDES